MNRKKRKRLSDEAIVRRSNSLLLTVWVYFGFSVALAPFGYYVRRTDNPSEHRIEDVILALKTIVDGLSFLFVYFLIVAIVVDLLGWNNLKNWNEKHASPGRAYRLWKSTLYALFGLLVAFPIVGYWSVLDSGANIFDVFSAWWDSNFGVYFLATLTLGLIVMWWIRRRGGPYAMLIPPRAQDHTRPFPWRHQGKEALALAMLVPPFVFPIYRVMYPDASIFYPIILSLLAIPFLGTFLYLPFLVLGWIAHKSGLLEVENGTEEEEPEHTTGFDWLIFWIWVGLFIVIPAFCVGLSLEDSDPAHLYVRVWWDLGFGYYALLGALGVIAEWCWRVVKYRDE